MSLESTRFVSRFIVSSSCLLAKLDRNTFDGTCTATCVWVMDKLKKLVDIKAVTVDRGYMLRHSPDFKYRGHDFLWIPSISLYYDPTAMQLGVRTPLIFSKSSVPLIYGCEYYEIKEYNSTWLDDKMRHRTIQKIIESRPHTAKVLAGLESVYTSCVSAWSLSDDDIKNERLNKILTTKGNYGT